VSSRTRSRGVPADPHTDINTDMDIRVPVLQKPSRWPGEAFVQRRRPPIRMGPAWDERSTTVCLFWRVWAVLMLAIAAMLAVDRFAAWRLAIVSASRPYMAGFRYRPWDPPPSTSPQRAGDDHG
jgi:hypothetical protein